MNKKILIGSIIAAIIIISTSFTSVVSIQTIDEKQERNGCSLCAYKQKLLEMPSPLLYSTNGNFFICFFLSMFFMLLCIMQYEEGTPEYEECSDYYAEAFWECLDV